VEEVMGRKKQDERKIDPEELVDEALEETFPASDPISPGVGPGEPLSQKNVRKPGKPRPSRSEP
jgi:hypothetical protein